MTQTERSEIRQILAAALGQGHRIGRAEILADLDGWRERTGRPRRDQAPAASEPQPAPTAPLLALPIPGRAVSVAEAAHRLGVAEVTVRRYLAPSAGGRLARLAGGVSLASVIAYAARRDEAILRTRGVAGPGLRAA
ncbi:hypothetical protein [Parafrankia sp. EUN1f]|uniref:hypothetical protein n=1 Tax=Parafrankia sp. EUN1f TaxID=102897 RepID=UPI0001C4535C|nr:hypothetical protein [Parafrankia sp. EUN1f]EFC78899.1 hypothetical protein FrEUN1fDRAFT_7981 [Parafrankia sp. EUN1f]